MRSGYEARQAGPGSDYFFSDAVFAIAITLLSLDLKLPTQARAYPVSQDLLSIWPEYQSYVTSFLVIGLYWISHHHYFRFIRRYNAILISLNIIFLMCIVFLPFATSVLDSFSSRPGAIIFYAACMALTGLLKTGLWHYAAYRHRLVHHRLSSQRIRRLTWLAVMPPAVFLGSIGIAFWNPALAKGSWIAIALFYLTQEFFGQLSQSIFKGGTSTR